MPITLLVTAAVSASIAAGPPATRVEPVTERMHGQTFVDDYRWLEPLESESEAVAEWTTRQNEYTRGILDGLPGRPALEARLGELMKIGSVTAPTMRRNRYFYTERAGTQNQAVLYLRDGHDGEAHVLLDPNTLDERGLYALDWYVPSPDGSRLAFGLSHAGDEMTVCYVMDVDSRTWLAEEIPGKIGFVGWNPGGDGFLYGKLEDPSDAYSRSYRYHEIGRHHRQDPMLIMQTEPSRIPGLRVSRDGRWIISTMFEGWSKQDVYVVDAEAWRRTGEFDRTPIAVGLDARFSPQFIHGDTLYLLTTKDAPNGTLVAVDLVHPERPWRVIIPEPEAAVLKGVSEARGLIVASLQKDATSRFKLMDLDGKVIGDLGLPGLGSASVTTHFDRTEAFLTYTSFNEPTSIYRLDLATGERELWARPDVPVDPSSVVVKQEWTTSTDGTRVPMFIVHKKGLEPNGRTPTLLYGYGGFNVSLTPSFRATRFPWFENGGIFVIATLRGGGEYGESWHQDGMLAKKQNVFDDLYAVAEHLIREGYTSPDHLAVLGGSNGGLLTGVAVTQRPDLWTAVISAVPLLDMLRYQHLLMAKFWVPEYGDPEDPEHYQWLRAYSPYHNVKPGKKYPAVLFTAGENDNRVHPMHARKMAAAMQAASTSDLEDEPILLWVNREAGHGQGKPLHLQIRDVADRYAFIMWQTGMYYE
ncbi:MAG: prolyl oligopeptidase family serine peptidase [Planctomycetota bacterium]|jgi:prolyl oligopeptidase